MTPEPRSISGAVTLAHLYDAIEAGLGPLRQDIWTLRRDLHDVSEVLDTVADDIVALSRKFETRGQRVRGWLATNATTAVMKVAERIAIAAAGAVAAYLATHL